MRESLVIFAGVAIALAADDWRETQAERDEAARSLEIILTDLRRDSTQIMLTRSDGQGQAASAEWLLMRWDDSSADRDSVAAVLFEFEQAPRPAFSRAGFEGLLSANRLRLLKAEALRSALFQYYQVDQVQIANYWEVVWSRREKMLNDLAPHVLHVGSLSTGRKLVLRTDWSTLTSDPIVQGDLVRYGGAIGYTVDELAILQSSVDSLIQAIRVETGT